MSEQKLDYCNGFLQAMQLLNSEVSDVYADFELEILPPSNDLKSALSRYFEDYGKYRILPAKEFRAEQWNIATVSLMGPPEQALYEVCERWFFNSSTMISAPKGHHYRHNVIVTFIDALTSAIGTFRASQVLTHPPIWYAMAWDDIALETDHARFLLHFSHSD